MYILNSRCRRTRGTRVGQNRRGTTAAISSSKRRRSFFEKYGVFHGGETREKKAL